MINRVFVMYPLQVLHYSDYLSNYYGSAELFPR